MLQLIQKSETNQLQRQNKVPSYMFAQWSIIRNWSFIRQGLASKFVGLLCSYLPTKAGPTQSLDNVLKYYIFMDIILDHILSSFK